MSDDIIPDDFDLDKARYSQKSSTPDDKRKRCPYCDSHSISRVIVEKPGGIAIREHNNKYRCDNCSETFDDPIKPKET